MKTYPLLLSLASLAFFCALPPVSAVYAPEVSVSPEQQKDVSNAQRALKSLSPKDRQLFLAYKLGLLIKPSEGGWAYYDYLDDNFDSDAALYAVSDEAHAVLPSGKLVPFSDAAKKLSTKKLQDAARAMAKVGDAPVCIAFADEVSSLVNALVHHYFSLFSPLCRDAFLAIFENAVLDESGNTVEPRLLEKNVMGVRNAKFKYPDFLIRNGTFSFKDRSGNLHNLQDTIKSLHDKNLHAATDHLFWCASLVGKNDIIAVLSAVDKKKHKSKK